MHKLLSPLIELVISGGFVMPPLIIGSAFLWYALVYRFQSLKRGSDKGVFELMSNPSYLSNTASKKSAFLTYLSEIKSRDKDHSFITLSNAFDHFSKYKTLVTTVVMVAPLLGLLGTVSGMIETFEGLGNMSLFTQSGGIAGGISQALVSTQMGLAVAIPGLVVGKMLARKQTSLMTELEQACEILYGDTEVNVENKENGYA